MSKIPKEDSTADSMDYISKKTKSELYHIWKKARLLFEKMSDDSETEVWVKKNIMDAHDLLDEAYRWIEYEELIPTKKEGGEPEADKNNFLTNQDKRYPVPVAGENGDKFITRCILDANMKKRYPVQGDRFNACMIVFNEKKDTPADPSSPGEKFEDPMAPSDPEIEEPVKPLLP